jgi:4-azaleucine resistance transporter AzlC
VREQTDTPSLRAATPKSGWQRGLALGAPIVLGYVPIGFAYGVLSTKSGLSARNTLLMSLLVYAGASQFIAAGLFAAGAAAGSVSPLSIVLTTFITNLRHLLMSASLAPYLREWSKPALAAFAYQLTDETFAVHAAHVQTARAPVEGMRKGEAFCVNIIAQLAWITGGWLGVIGGRYVPDPRPFGLDYALPALFVALLVLQINGATKPKSILAGVAGITGLVSVGLTLWGLDHWSVVLATLLGATLGVLIEQWTKKPSP